MKITMKFSWKITINHANPKSQIDALLGMGEISMGGQKVVVTQVRSRCRASDIFAWVAEELRILEES